MRNLYEKYKDVIPYLFFGACTTLVNIVVYWVYAHLLVISTLPSTIVAWIVAVVFAYFTNRKWVFHSNVVGYRNVFNEMIAFFGCRLATGILDCVMMYCLVDCLHLNDIVIKCFANIIVIVLNYLASKMVVFKRK